MARFEIPGLKPPTEYDDLMEWLADYRAVGVDLGCQYRLRLMTADLREVEPGNGYPWGGKVVGPGTVTVTFRAAGGSVGPFRVAALCDPLPDEVEAILRPFQMDRCGKLGREIAADAVQDAGFDAEADLIRTDRAAVRGLWRYGDTVNLTDGESFGVEGPEGRPLLEAANITLRW